jgi:hypothetical protein
MRAYRRPRAAQEDNAAASQQNNALVRCALSLSDERVRRMRLGARPRASASLLAARPVLGRRLLGRELVPRRARQDVHSDAALHSRCRLQYGGRERHSVGSGGGL